MTASELALQASQDTRTWGQSALNITAGTLLAGTFGAGMAALGKLRGPLVAEIERDLGPDFVAMAKPKLVPRASLLPDIEPQPAMGVGKASAAIHLSPKARVLFGSQLQSARRAMVRLTSIPFHLKHEKLGIDTPASVHDKIGLHKLRAVTFVQEQKRLYAEYIEAAPWKGAVSRATGLAPAGMLFVIVMMFRLSTMR